MQTLSTMENAQFNSLVGFSFYWHGIRATCKWLLWAGSMVRSLGLHLDICEMGLDSCEVEPTLALSFCWLPLHKIPANRLKKAPTIKHKGFFDKTLLQIGSCKHNWANVWSSILECVATFSYGCKWVPNYPKFLVPNKVGMDPFFEPDPELDPCMFWL